MAFYKVYTLTDIMDEAGAESYTGSEAISALYDLFTNEENTQFDCLDFVKSGDTMAIAYKDRQPRITTLTTIVTNNSYIYLTGSSSSTAISVSGITAASNNMAIETLKIVFVRNDYGDCIINFYDKSTDYHRAYIFAECTDGVFRICSSYALSSTTSYSNLYCWYTASNEEIVPMVSVTSDTLDSNKYLLPIAAPHSMFKRVYWAINRLHSFVSPYELNGKKYFETGGMCTGFRAAALLYEE